MLSKSTRSRAVWLSLALTVLSQLPVVTAQPAQSPCDSHPPGFSSACAVTDTSTIYDADEHLWKRWSLEGNALRLSTSPDGNSWDLVKDTAFAPAAQSDAWDHSFISSPVVLLNPDAVPNRRFMLWYVGSNNSTASGGGMPSTSVGVAFSPDGRNFARLPAVESPANADGLALSPVAAFTDNKVAGGSLGEPRISLSEGKFTMSFFRVGTDSDGLVENAGLATAVSDDGIKWTVRSDAPMTIEVVGRNTTSPRLVQRLRQLVDAYAECPM